ncbi:potassium transporter Kup [Sphingorhabdus pulchriflava]|uniref:Probable potassium transport system protein Kup n=1 Tax=Sphingorhabdus pulchriflava TaxID=2292257 RepID=A0A371BJE8_9SPHN|nr:potassium transporter Kup [Sphingorhabdus pulchriflava]RDV07677.1 potassium transporter Kup [Sphingorhabdus pulchriflava]
MHDTHSGSVDSQDIHKHSLAALTIGAIGVVFGDIGTSPLYAFREALHHSSTSGIQEAAIFGVLSLALWSLILVVTVKYVIFLMRADNDGEGGVLALLALAGRGIGGRKGAVLALGAVGAALFYGDAIITPALSVLSAVEGTKTIPGIGENISEQVIINITLVILIALFAIQFRGTAAVSKLFGPICVVWFLAIGGLGAMHISDYPSILGALSPHHAVSFLTSNGMIGLIVLGSVFLTVTGAEALTADMGHFGRFPIRLAWFALVFPALALNYFGQGAFAMAALREAQAAGIALETRDWFFLMSPEFLRVPLIILAGLATIIASQAVITGAYSLTQQAIQLGLLPRMKIVQTSPGSSGQIYIPAINWMLLLGVWLLVVQFRNSSSMASAYGIAVTGTMVVTTCLAFVVVHKLWKWSLAKSLLVIVPFLTIDFIFFGANILRVVDGGWVPLAVGAFICLIIWIWVRGKRVIDEKENEGTMTLAELAATLAKRPPSRVDGTAVYLSANPDGVPGTILHNLKHNRVLHARNLVLTVRTSGVPHVPADQRAEYTIVNEDFARVILRYGFMDTPDVPNDLAAAIPKGMDKLNPMTTSYFVGRNVLSASKDEGLPIWQDMILIFLQRNAYNPAEFFQIPSNRIVALGAQLVV